MKSADCNLFSNFAADYQRISKKYYNIMMTANEIRNSYLKFFESKGHVIVPSAPIVVKDDPTLMFTSGRTLSLAQKTLTHAAEPIHKSACV